MPPAATSWYFQTRIACIKRMRFRSLSDRLLIQRWAGRLATKSIEPQLLEVPPPMVSMPIGTLIACLNKIRVNQATHWRLLELFTRSAGNYFGPFQMAYRMTFLLRPA